MKSKILMVCLGNICRSPLAEGILNQMILERELFHLIEVDSAGTIGQHKGNFPDPRSQEVAKQNGFSLTHLSRQLTREDFMEFDHILVMDESNLKDSLKFAKNDFERSKVRLITEFDQRIRKPKVVPDPYWGDLDDFKKVYEQLKHCCEGWLSSYLQSKKEHVKIS